jgi:hypothetical protein
MHQAETNRAPRAAAKFSDEARSVQKKP